MPSLTLWKIRRLYPCRLKLEEVEVTVTYPDSPQWKKGESRVGSKGRRGSWRSSLRIICGSTKRELVAWGNRRHRTHFPFLFKIYIQGEKILSRWSFWLDLWGSSWHLPKKLPACSWKPSVCDPVAPWGGTGVVLGLSLPCFAPVSCHRCSSYSDFSFWSMFPRHNSSLFDLKANNFVFVFMPESLLLENKK